MTNAVDTAAEKLSKVSGKIPLVSIFTAAALPAAAVLAAINPLPLIVVGAVAPGLCLLTTLNGGVNLFRSHGNVSKAFSAAAAVGGVVGLAGYLGNINTPDFGALAGFMQAAAAMTFAGVMNTAAFYTRRVSLQLKADIKPTSSDKTPPPAP